MEVISSIYNSGYNIKKFYLGSRELNLAYLGNQVIYDEVIGDNDLNYILYEFYGSDTLPNTVEAPVKSAILKGNTGYRDIDTGEFLETFEKGRNLELVSVKMPVLKTVGKNLFSGYNEFIKVNHSEKLYLSSSNTTGATRVLLATYDENKNLITSPNAISSNNGAFSYRVAVKRWMLSNDRTQLNNQLTLSDDVKYIVFETHNGFYMEYENIQLEESLIATSYEPYKSNILTVNEDVTLRSNGDVYDELNLLTGRLTQRIDENNEVLSQEVVKTVDLTMVDQDEQTISKLNSFNGTTHVSTEVAENSIYPTIAIEVATE